MCFFNLSEKRVNAEEFFWYFQRNHNRQGNFFTDERRFGFQLRVVIFASVIAAVRVCFSAVESLTDVRRFRRDLSSPPDGSVFVSVAFFRLFIYLFFASRPPSLSKFPPPLHRSGALAIVFGAKWPEIGRNKIKLVQIDRTIGLRRVLLHYILLTFTRFDEQFTCLDIDFH